MGFFGILKDVVLLPIDITLDVTGISAATELLNGKAELPDSLTPQTAKRLKSMQDNLNETYGVDGE